MSETSELTGPLAKLLRQAGVLTIRMQSGKVKVKGGWMYLCPNGTADLLCFPAGRPVTWVETKSLKGQSGDAQKSFCQLVEALGHRYLIARTLDEGLEAIR